MTWDLGSLSPEDSGTLRVRCGVPATVRVGSWLHRNAEITPVVGDTHPENNTDSIEQVIRGSFDPNEKSVVPASGVPEGCVLRYHIDFQSVGNDEAEDVIVRDTLEARIDITNVVQGATSHPCVVAIDERTIIWTFAGIDLPDSNSNEPESHGFVEFTACPIAGLEPLSEIRNSAAIYFDFNPPAITNEVVNYIMDPASAQDPAPGGLGSGVRIQSVTPNPSRAGFALRLDSIWSGSVRVEVHDVVGRLVRRFDVTIGASAMVHCDGRTETGSPVEPGVYFVRVRALGSHGEGPTQRLVLIRYARAHSF